MSATPSQTRAEDRAAPPLSERTRSTRLRSVRARLLRLVGGAASLALTIAVIAGAGLAVLQGSAFLAERADAAAPPPEAPVPASFPEEPEPPSPDEAPALEPPPDPPLPPGASREAFFLYSSER